MIYFDNSATSYPKPLSVRFKAAEASRRYSFNSGRSGYTAALKAAEKIYLVREKIADMFNCQPENVAFTKNCTEALNYAIKGSAEKGSHIIISSLEHNSVSRVVKKLSDDGVSDFTVVPFSFNSAELLSSIKKSIRNNTTLLVFTAASNVFGAVMPYREIGKICREHSIRFVLDSAQCAGILPIDMKRDNIDILCAPSHKGLLGTMGAGFIALNEGVVLKPTIQGGTGSSSLSLNHPSFMPDMLEAGTLNNSGIISLGAGIDYILKRGMHNIYMHEMELTGFMYEALSDIKSVLLYTPYPEINSFVPVLSFNVNGLSSEETALKLSDKNICTRAGYHCSPLAHKHFNTVETGTVRLSLGAFNTQKECERFINVVKKF